MSIVRVGSNKKFSDNWENIFAGKKSSVADKKPAAKKKKAHAKVSRAAKKK